jgi:hypothetical protein
LYQVELVARVPVLEDLGARRVRLFGRDFGDELERRGLQPGKELDAGELLEPIFHPRPGR